ncbi:hypothetical protein RCG19_15960 [Neobacillus sp. OS1-2]|uniref:hypothetical protein n=1 Tax=Neobacillus sp. OS1-2 TaxID=3070680 RepID=UPI0027E17B28|nr:hypothetical protein [Neobacillus sp. OS1-2]WML38683.1 hypothetical protein RCG19_15960 [Neobacillus sp. OS1-2]
MSARCGVCGGHGYVIDKLKKEVKMECCECSVTWVTDSKTCPKCKKPNGFAVDGVYAQCYAEHFKSS